LAKVREVALCKEDAQTSQARKISQLDWKYLPTLSSGILHKLDH